MTNNCRNISKANRSAVQTLTSPSLIDHTSSYVNLYCFTLLYMFICHIISLLSCSNIEALVTLFLYLFPTIEQYNYGLLCHSWKFHYPRSGHHCRFKNPLHCRILNRQWHTGSDGGLTSLPVPKNRH